MRLVVEVPDKKLERFRAAVEADNRTQADVIREAIDEYIKRAEKLSRQAATRVADG